MKLRRPAPAQHSETIIALIDVVLFLLIFFVEEVFFVFFVFFALRDELVPLLTK